MVCFYAHLTIVFQNRNTEKPLGRRKRIRGGKVSESARGDNVGIDVGLGRQTPSLQKCRVCPSDSPILEPMTSDTKPCPTIIVTGLESDILSLFLSPNP
jgi:hypothetical protein